MILHVDKLQPDDFGGITKDMDKIRYALKKFNIDLNDLKSSHFNDNIPTGVFHAGRYVVIFQFNQTFTTGVLTFINSKVDLSKFINVFADTLTPKVVGGFHEMQTIIKRKNITDLSLVELTDEPLISQIFFQN